MRVAPEFDLTPQLRPTQTRRLACGHKSKHRRKRYSRGLKPGAQAWEESKWASAWRARKFKSLAMRSRHHFYALDLARVGRCAAGPPPVVFADRHRPYAPHYHNRLETLLSIVEDVRRKISALICSRPTQTRRSQAQAPREGVAATCSPDSTSGAELSHV